MIVSMVQHVSTLWDSSHIKAKKTKLRSQMLELLSSYAKVQFIFIIFRSVVSLSRN
jgi:hypothetical protein